MNLSTVALTDKLALHSTVALHIHRLQIPGLSQPQMKVLLKKNLESSKEVKL